MGYQIASTPQERKSLPSRGLKTSPMIWMGEKRDRDQQLWGAGNDRLWIVENKIYDLSSYIDRHPGGESWLRLTRGQDITEHFVIHHLNQKKARDVLAKYYVRDCPNSVTRFSFQQHGLYRAVKRKVLETYTPEQVQDQSRSKIYAVIILLAWLVAITLTCLLNSLAVGVLCAPLMVGLVGIGHNFIHHHESIYRYFFLLTGFTHREWQIMHCISHHLYPNTELDYEIAAFEPIAFYLRNFPQNKWYMQIVLEALFFLLQPLNMLLKLLVIPIMRRTGPDLFYATPMLIFAFFLSQNSLGDAIKLYLVVYCSFGYLLMKVLFCGHRVQDTWTQGCTKIEDFGEHTVCSTSDTDSWVEGIWSYILLAGFNIHVAHHFFPTADHKILPKINDIIRQQCSKRGLKKNEKSRIECQVSLIKGFSNRQPYVNK